MSVIIAVYLLVVSKPLLAPVNCDSINFYNIRPPVDATPYPKSFKCFTCEQASDNYSCNRWAEDKWCPQNTQYCMTIHHFGRHGKTKFVTKRCASVDDCNLTGCRHHGKMHHAECVSCCEGMACNVELPTNHTNARICADSELQFQCSTKQEQLLLDSLISTSSCGVVTFVKIQQCCSGCEIPCCNTTDT